MKCIDLSIYAYRGGRLSLILLFVSFFIVVYMNL